jgi:hypothetical protein
MRILGDLVFCSNVRFAPAVSTGRGNTFRELFCWGLIEQGLSGPFIELVECLSANAAVMRTEALAHKPGHVFEL